MTDSKPEILKWNKQKVYRCRLCAFDTLHQDKFEQHFAAVHPPLRVIKGDKQAKPDGPANATNKKGTE